MMSTVNRLDDRHAIALAPRFTIINFTFASIKRLIGLYNYMNEIYINELFLSSVREINDVGVLFWIAPYF